MGFKEFIATGKGKAITIASGATVAAVGIAAAVLLQGGGFRSIVVQNVTGTVDIVGEKNNGQAFEGQNLYSGDDVTVGDVSELVMRMDADKYVYADANTHFSLEASDANEDSLIKIYLDKGSELNELQTKLGPNDEYEVDTPSSTLAVRGTTFRVTVYEDGDGKSYTLLEVTEGFVEVELKTTDGVYTGVKETFTAGQSALIRADSSISEFLVGDEEEIVLKLNYAKLPEEAVPRLEALLEVVEGNVIKGDLELQGEEEDEENEDQALEPTPTPTPTPEIVLVPDPDGDGPDGGNGDGEGDGEGTEQPLLQGRSLHIHTPSDWLLAQSASCLSDGYYLKVCTVCNAAVDSQTIAKTGHRLVDGVCANCGYGTPVAEDEPVVASASESSSSSEETTPSHTHSWTYEYFDTSKSTSHTKTCECGESVVESHTFSFPRANYGVCNYCGADVVVAACTTHTWVGNRCSVCGASTCVDHTWNSSNGTCSVCGVVCQHISYNSVTHKCGDCGMACTHPSYDSVYKCVKCGEYCTHEGHYSAGKCTRCGKTCEHGGLDGKSGICPECGEDVTFGP